MSHIYILAIVKFSNPQDDLQENLHKLVQASQAEAGNISYELYQDENEPHTFIFQEIWQDSSIFDLHKNTAHFIAFVEYATKHADSVEIKQLKKL